MDPEYHSKSGLYAPHIFFSIQWQPSVFRLVFPMKQQPELEPSQQSVHLYLVDRCLEGDRKAQFELYKLYSKAMYNICRRLMGNEEEAKDVLQDAFVSAFTKLKTFNRESTFGAWLKRIVVNHCINALNKKRIRFEDIDENREPAIAEDTSEFDYARAGAARIQSAIDKISDGCKTVLNLYLFEGYDHREIAGILNITESTSKAQYSKAKKRIRQILETEY
jgi:RNA polymerase sigma-70 factor (ECF subfamily)